MKNFIHTYTDNADCQCSSCGNKRNHGAIFDVKAGMFKTKIFVCIVCMLPVITQGVDFLEKIENDKNRGSHKK